MIKTLHKNDIRNTPFSTVKDWKISNTENDNLVLMEHSGNPVAVEYLTFNNVTSSINTSSNVGLEQQLSDRIIFRDGKKSQKIFYPESEEVNEDGTFKSIVYSQIKNIFYNEYKDPTQIWGIENLDFEKSNTKRFLTNDFRLYDIPTSIFGEKILEKSVTVYNKNLDNDYTIEDDGYNNLYAQLNLFTRQQELGFFNNYFYNGHDYTCCSYLGICP